MSRVLRAGLAAAAVTATLVPAGMTTMAHAATTPTDTLTLTARGSLVNGVGPHLNIRVNGADAGSATVNNTSMGSVSIALNQKVTNRDRLDIMFDNDSVVGTADRNLWVTNVTSASGGSWKPSQGVVDNGDTWAAATDGLRTTKVASDGGIWGNSALRFAPTVASVTTQNVTTAGFSVVGSNMISGDHMDITWVQNGSQHSATTTSNSWSSGQINNWSTARVNVISASGTAMGSATATAPKPMAARGNWFLDTGNAAYWGWKMGTYKSNPDENRALYNLGNTVTSTWYDGVQAGDDARMQSQLDAAKAKGQVAQLVIYGIPNRDCGSFSAGGQADATSYKAWIDRVSKMVGNQPVLVTVEPDAISYCGLKQTDPKRIERGQLLTYVGQKFQQNNPNAALYLHMGSGTLGQNDAAKAALAAGIQYYRGFAMNVASDNTTANNEAWAEQFIKTMAAQGVQNLHYIVDTSRNGRGTQANPGLLANVTFQSCNNPNQSVGVRPTGSTDSSNADAWVWVKLPGYSDGVCHAGEPKGGAFFPQLAEKLIDNAASDGTIQLWALPS